MSASEPYYQDACVSLYLGDAREILPDVLPDERQVWLTDPPYSSGGFQEAGRAGGSIGKMGGATKNDTIATDTLSTRGYMNLMRDVLRHSRHAVEVGIFTDWRMWVNTTDAMEYAGLTMRAMIVWSKGNNGIGRPWRNQHELVAYGMREASSKDRVAKHGNVIQCARSGNANHPTEKPLELVRKIVDNMGEELVVDPFVGSGTILRAAKDLGRRAIGIELDERYCEVAAQRMCQENLFGALA
jgi:DNA modification methylase